MILVVGETLVDLVVDVDGGVDAVLGGAPSNTAVAAARLGATVRFTGSVSTDRFGDRLVARLAADGVDVAGITRTQLPTSLAMAELDEHGAAEYRFYFDGTSVPELRRVDTKDARVIVTGGLALVLEPMASAVERCVVDADVPVVVDVNVRPAVIDDLVGYRRRITDVLTRSAVVKVSDDDLAALAPGRAPIDVADELVAAGAGAVVVTRGAVSTSIVTRRGRREVPVAALPAGCPVVDTIGAGDTFGAGLVTSLDEQGAFAADDSAPSVADLDVLEQAVRLGHAAASVTVTRRGADPPRRDELVSSG